MRTRATRFSLVLALAALLAGAGASGPAAGVRASLRDLPRTAAVPAHGAAAAAAAAVAGLAGPHAVIGGHKRPPAVDAALVPATLLAMVVLAWMVRSRRPNRPSRAPARGYARAPPVRWQ